MEALLDTSVVIALFQQDSSIDVSGFDRLFISSLTLAELQLGVAMAGSTRVMRRRGLALDAVRETFGEGLPFDDHAALIFGRLATAVVERGGDAKANRMDRMIAAVAAANELALVTLNARDVRLLDRELEIIDAESLRRADRTGSDPAAP